MAVNLVVALHPRFGMNSGDNVFGDGDMSGAFKQGSAAEFQSYLIQQNVNSTLDLMLGKGNYSVGSNGNVFFNEKLNQFQSNLYNSLGIGF